MTFLLNSHQSPHVSEKHLHTDHKQVKISKRSVVLLHRQSKDELITFIANDVTSPTRMLCEKSSILYSISLEQTQIL